MIKFLNKVIKLLLFTAVLSNFVPSLQAMDRDPSIDLSGLKEGLKKFCSTYLKLVGHGTAEEMSNTWQNLIYNPSESKVVTDFKKLGKPALKRLLSSSPQDKDGNPLAYNGELIKNTGTNLLQIKARKVLFDVKQDIKDESLNVYNGAVDTLTGAKYLRKNKYRIAGATVAAIIATAVLVKATQMVFEKAINLLTKSDPKFLAHIKLNNSIFEKIKSLVGYKTDNSLFLNSENAKNVPLFILKNNLVTKSNQKDLTYNNLVLTGPDIYTKFKICDNIVAHSGQNLVVIDAHSNLFDQALNDDQKRILVKKFFDKLQSNGKSLVLVNLDQLATEQLDNNGSKNILIDIVNFSKIRTNKIGFVFACSALDGEFKKLLEGSYDEFINIEKPDKNAREQIIDDGVNKLIFNSSVSILQKLKIKSQDISKEKQDSFKSYLTPEKLSWMAQNLEGKSYQEVRNFVLRLKALLSQTAVASISNYDYLVKILLKS